MLNNTETNTYIHILTNFLMCMRACVFIMLSITSLMCVLSFKLREEIDKYGIKIYQFPDCDSDEDEDFKKQDKELKVTSVSDLMSITHDC